MSPTPHLAARRNPGPLADAGPGRPAAVRRRERWGAFAIGLGLTLLFAFISYAADRGGNLPGFVEQVETGLLDLKFRLRGPLPPSPHVALVTIGQDALDRYGRFPFSRAVFADALRALDEAGAAQVIVDLVFSERTTPEDDLALVRALEDVRTPVLLGYFFYTGGDEVVPSIAPARRDDFRRLTRTLPAGCPGERCHLLSAREVQPIAPDIQEAADGAGFVNVRPGRGGIVRQAQLVIEWRGGTYPSIEVLAAANVLAGTGSGLPVMLTGSPAAPRLDILGRGTDLDATGAALLNYPGPPGALPTVGMAELLDPSRAADNATVLRGRSVFMGPAAVGISDTRDTPFRAASPAMEIHAAILDNLLEQRFLRRPPWLMAAEWLAMIASGALLALALAFAPTRAAIPAIAATLGALLALDLAVLFPRGLWAQPVAPSLEILCVAVVVTALRLRQEARSRAAQERAREQLLSLFGRYVAPGVIDQMMRNPERVRLGGERREISVLFSDIRGFTAVAEGMEPERLTTVLNTYLGAMTDAVHGHGGMLDKYMGDGIMALFGVPMDDADHAASACDAALAQLDALAGLNRSPAFRRALGGELSIGIGINTGSAAVGNMGSEQRFEFTAMGDEVNVASRLEGLTRRYGVACIVSDATRQRAGTRFRFRELDRVRVKGRRSALTIHQLVGRAEDPPADHHADYERALEAFRSRRWEEAADACGKTLRRAPEDHPARLLLERIEAMRASPPPEDWDGSYSATAK